MTRTMTRMLARTAGVTLAVILLAGTVSGCGRYGSPQAYPPEGRPGVEEPDEEEQR